MINTYSDYLNMTDAEISREIANLRNELGFANSMQREGRVVATIDGDAARNGSHQDDQKQAHSKPTTSCAWGGHFRKPTF